MTEFISPLSVIHNLSAKIFNDQTGFITKREYEKDRESFVVAMILIGIHKITKTSFFMKLIEQKKNHQMQLPQHIE